MIWSKVHVLNFLSIVTVLRGFINPCGLLGEISIQSCEKLSACYLNNNIFNKTAQLILITTNSLKFLLQMAFT